MDGKIEEPEERPTKPKVRELVGSRVDTRNQVFCYLSHYTSITLFFLMLFEASYEP